MVRRGVLGGVCASLVVVSAFALSGCGGSAHRAAPVRRSCGARSASGAKGGCIAPAPTPGQARSRSGSVASVSTSSTTSGGLPASPIYVDYSSLQIKPREITYTGDSTGILTGAGPPARAASIQWTRWTAQSALGTGFNDLNDCEPGCDDGTFHYFPVKIEQWRPASLGGRLVFTRMTIWYQDQVPAGQARYYTFTDVHSRQGYAWGPPERDLYCVNTHGLPPAVGCRNTRELPPGSGHS